MLTVFIGGAVFFIASYFAQALFPDVSHFKNTDDTLPEIGLYVGGTLFKLLFISGAFAAWLRPALLPCQCFAAVICDGEKRRPAEAMVRVRASEIPDPAWNVILVGLVSLLAITPSLELISSFINFGALIAFTFVNLSVIAFFVFRKKRYKTAKDVFSYLVMPLAGAGLTGVLWSNLQKTPSFSALSGQASDLFIWRSKRNFSASRSSIFNWMKQKKLLFFKIKSNGYMAEDVQASSFLCRTISNIKI